MGLAPGTSADPSDSMNTIKSSGFTHQWFPRQKTPSTDWEARLDYLMDAQMRPWITPAGKNITMRSRKSWPNKCR